MQRNELVKNLYEFHSKPVIEEYIRKYNLNKMTVNEILNFSFGNSIKRAFYHETPTLRYYRWRWYKNPNELVNNLNIVRSQEDFDKFVYDLGESLVIDWGKLNNNGQQSRMNKGVAMKIINLIIKPITFSKYGQNPNIKGWLHIPWDKFTLRPLNGIWKGYPVISQSVSMGFVNNLDLYKQLHNLISDITQEAGVSRISYEFWAWDKEHQ